MSRDRDVKGKNPYKDRRAFKSKEIKKSLTHRASLRKKYFKILEKEGFDSPEGRGENDEKQVDKVNIEHSGNEFGAANRKPQTFAERAKMVKQRKEQKRQAQLKNIQERKMAMEKRKKERERKKEVVGMKTKQGQPLMGPRINNLLDKIREGMK